jgi:FkbM family methyltransferase
VRVYERALAKIRRDGLVALGVAGIRIILESCEGTYSALRERMWLFRLHRQDCSITREGVQLDLSDGYIKDRYRTLFMDGVPEDEELQSIKRYLPSHRDVVELGGGVGFIACYVNRQIVTDRTHLVVEANERLIPTIERNRDLNNCTFDVINRVYAPHADTVEFYLSDSFLESSTNETRAGRSTSAGKWPIVDRVEVPAIDMETLTDEYQLDEFVLIVDIEGSEADLLLDELDVLESRCSYLFIEFHFHPEIRDRVERARRELERSFNLIEENQQRKTLVQCVYRR